MRFFDINQVTEGLTKNKLLGVLYMRTNLKFAIAFALVMAIGPLYSATEAPKKFCSRNLIAVINKPRITTFFSF